MSNEPSIKVNKQLGDTGPLQTLAKGDKLTVTVERVDGGKLRCTGATWTDAVVIFPGEVLAFQNIERRLPVNELAPDGRTVLLTHLCEGQAATVLQLPAQPATAAEVDAQKRVTYVG